MPVCPVCSNELSGKSTLCIACGTPHDLECWGYNGDKCATFSCGSTVRGSEVVTIDGFVKEHLTPAYSKVSILLQGTPHIKEIGRCNAIYQAGLNLVISPPNAHNQLLEELKVWRDYYRGRLESIAASDPLVESILKDHDSCKGAVDGSGYPAVMDYLSALNKMVDAMEIAPEKHFVDVSCKLKESVMATFIGLGYVFAMIPAAIYVPSAIPVCGMGAFIGAAKSQISALKRDEQEKSRDFLVAKIDAVYHG